MPVYKDEKRGTWYVRVKVKNPATGEWVGKTKRGFATKREAKEAERELLSEPNTSQNLTFHQISDEYNNFKQFSPEQKRKHEVHFEKRFSKYYDMPIKKITPAMLVSWETDLITNDTSATKTKNDTITFVKGVFKHAATVYGVKDISVVLEPIRKTKEEIMREMEVWTPEEFEQFISCVDGEHFRNYYTFLYWSGCRRGEAIALQKSDVVGDAVTISKSMKHYINGFTPTKTGTTRKIQMDSVTLAMLNREKEQPGPFVFGGETSLSITAIDSRFKKAIEKSGVKKIRLHDLRHSHATLLINSGVNIVAVSKRLGHATIEQTLKTYTHLLESTDNDMMTKIEDIRKK